MSEDAARGSPPRELLAEFLRLYPFQPATAFFRWFEVGAILSQPLPGGLGLDLGCGDGKLAQVISTRARWALVGLDADPAEVALARQQPCYHRLHCAPAHAVPEPDAGFDFVFSNSALEHMDRPAAVLREARRVLRRGGELLLTVPSAELHECLGGPPLLWRAAGCRRARYLDEFDRRIALAFLWTDVEWASRLQEAGFDSVEITPCLERSVVRRWESLANWTSGLLWKIGRGQRSPLEIQRGLGMRGPGLSTPRPLATALARALSWRLRLDPGRPAAFGNRFIRARAA